MDFLIKINSDHGLIYIIIRSFLLFGLSIFLLRYGNRRYNLNTAFDYLLLMIAGSVISRGINGSAGFLDSAVAAISLFLLHRFIAIITFHFGRLEPYFKGEANLVIKDGEILRQQLKKYHLTESDIHSSLRSELAMDDIKQISAAYLEATGRLSFIPKKKP